jgi:hypothetical protein
MRHAYNAAHHPKAIQFQSGLPSPIAARISAPALRATVDQGAGHANAEGWAS